MKKATIFFFAAICLMLNYAIAQKPVDKVPYSLKDDFETGEKFAWQPYPYEQDVGTTRGFYTRKSPTHNDSQWALWDPMRANDGVEAKNGFVKELNFWTTPQTRVKVAVFFQADRDPDQMQLSLGTFDGRRYMHTINNPKANRWLELDIPVSEFRLNGKPLGAGEHIQAVTLGGNYTITYYLHTYNMIMDDFMINGERERRFVAKNPVSTDFDMFGISILNKHYFHNDNITLSVSPEGNVPLTQLSGTLVDSKGKVVKDNIVFTKQGSEWSNNSIHQVSTSDATGQWQIRLTGTTPQGKEVRWGFRFLVPGKRINGHPRIQFSAEELKNRLANEKSPVAKRILEKALDDTRFMRVNIDSVHQFNDIAREALAGSTYGKYSSAQFSGNSSWNNTMGVPSEVVYEGSMRYAFTGDRAAAEQAKKALLKMSSYTQWTNNWMLDNHNYHWYPNGEYIKDVAYGYDILYNIMTDQERKIVRDAIMEKGLKMHYRDMTVLNRMPANVTNHIAVLVGGMGLAATAIYGDDQSNPYLEPYLSGIITKAQTFIDRTYYEDGSYGEPKSGYMNMASRAIGELIGPLERNFGVDLSTTTDVETFHKFLIQASHSSGRIQDFGDGGGPNGGNVSIGSQLHSWWFVHRTGNPLIYNYVKPFWEAGNGGYLSYLWYRDDITPVSRETLPTSKIFRAQGMVMRSGWDDASTIISSRIGPNSNHYHLDQGSFQIMTNGETLLTDPGVGTGGYYNNLEYQPYSIQAIAHNVLLVDNDSESQEPADYDIGIAALNDWPRMVHTFAGELADAVEADLATVYKKKLDTYKRTLLYTKSGPLFLFDQVKSKEGHTYDWLFHAAQNAGNVRPIAYDDAKKRLTIDRPNARLTLDVISPELGSTRIRDRNVHNESFINLTSKPNLREANFFAVIMPEAKPQSGNFGTRPTTTRMDSPGWVGARVERAGAVDMGFFRTGSNADAAGGFTTDATRFTASFDGSGTLLKAYFEGSNFSGSGLSVKSSVPLTLAIAPGSSGTKLEVNTQNATSVAISYPKQPVKVLQKDTEVQNWKYDAGTKTITIQVPAGRNDFTVQ